MSLIEFDFDSIDFLAEFCLNEIGLNGLEGCPLNDLFKQFLKSSNSIVSNKTNSSPIDNLNKIFSTINDNLATSSACTSANADNNNDKELYVNFIWKLLKSRSELSFYLTKDSSNENKQNGKNATSSKSEKKTSSQTYNIDYTKVINHNQNRGYSVNYFNRKCINQSIKSENNKTFQDCLKEYGSNLVVVANQQTRNKALCPSFKHLEFENLNDMEYCVLEATGKSRYEGVYTTGDDSLTQKFKIVPKQLHYILVNLESNQLIKRQVISSEKKRSIVHLARYTMKKKSIVENICDYLMMKGDKSYEACCETSVGLKRNLGLTDKQYKNVVSSAEKMKILKRYMADSKLKYKKKDQMVQSRMVKLTKEYYDSQKAKHAQTIAGDEDDGDYEEDSEGNDNAQIESIVENLGSAQSNTLPLYTQIFAKVEEYNKEGVSLKQLGTFFGFDFYKSRRMGNNLQTHPEIVTIIKETNRGKAKYQTVVLRKFLNLATKSNSAISVSNSQSDSANMDADLSISSNQTPELLILKREGQTKQNIQALMSNRTLMRKKMIADYLEKHKICTKYEITRELRTYESEQGLKGSIDSKTTKRMLINLEKEKKLRIFEVGLKNVVYMCIRSYEIEETDQIYKNYCATFKRTFDSVDLNVKSDMDQTALSVAASASQSDVIEEATNQNDKNESDELKFKTTFMLTKAFINSTVSKLKEFPHLNKIYSVVPKFQKAIILHRLLNYIIYFYDGVQQSVEPQEISETIAESTGFDSIDLQARNSCELPKLNQAYQPVDVITWKTFIPPLQRENFTPSPNSQPISINGSIFIGEIFSHMPLSVFMSIIVIKYQVPGLVAILKHPQKRHILVKDLPPELIAPLISNRKYLQRILRILQLLACLGLVSFVDSPCKTNQSINRDVQSQMIFIHKNVKFYDTSVNRCKDWNALKELNKINFNNVANEQTQNSTLISEEEKNIRYERCLFEFNSDDNVVEYWRKLLHVSMNTYKFSVGKYLVGNKPHQTDFLSKIVCKLGSLDEVNPIRPIEKFSDHMGPGGYDSQLFLNSFKNWMIPSSVGNQEASSNNRPKRPGARSSTIEPAITKDADFSTAPCSELALLFPFGVFRGIATSENQYSTKARANKKGITRSKRKIDSDLSDDSTEPSAVPSAAKKAKKPLPTRELKLQKAKYLVGKAKLSSAKMAVLVKQTQKFDDRRAQWHSDEDELILLIKCAHMYFLPHERSVPFKLIADIMNEIMTPNTCVNKKVSSFGRRTKKLLRLKANLIYVSNKLELCKQDKKLEAKYSLDKSKLKRSCGDREQVELYVRFINDLREKFLKKKNYGSERKDDDGKMDEEESPIELPDSLEEFNQKFKILNTQKDVFFNKPQSYFKQPTTDYEITCNTVQTAIHSSILINDKNPRVFESFNLFDKYSDQLLTDVIQRMSRHHKIIAPTKCYELKKKNVTAFSKHIGKAYHISQRYQYKWVNVISSNVLNETENFKEELVEFKQQQMKASNSHEEEMFDCTDKDDLGMTSFLAHTIDNSDVILNTII